MRRLSGVGLSIWLFVMATSVNALAAEPAAVGQSTGQVCMTITMTNGQPAPTDPLSLVTALNNNQATITSVDGPEACLPTSTGSKTPAPGGESITRSGTGMGESESFALTGGNYRADWTATNTGDQSVGCFDSLNLKSDAPFYNGTIDLTDSVTGTKSGTNHLHGVPAGSGFYIDASSGCQWSVTLTSE